MKRSEVSQAARELLNASGIDCAPVDLERLVDHLGISLVVEPLDDSVSGFLVVRQSRVSIGVNALHHSNRKRFTIAHELGHYALHRYASPLFVDSALTFYRDQQSANGTYRQEIEANSFAAELLMPEHLINRHLNEHQIDLHDNEAVENLAGDFGVSVQALSIRLINLGLVTA